MTDPQFEALLNTALPFALPLKRTFRGLDMREGVLIEGPFGWGEFAPFDDYSDEAAARWLANALEAAYVGWPEPLRTHVSSNAIIPALAPDEAASLARAAIRAHGCTVMKIKVGGDRAQDVARVQEVRDVLDLEEVDGSIRLDANAAWSREEAISILTELSRLGIEYAEQPCRSLDDLAAVREATGVAIAADESIRTDPSAANADLREYVDYAIVKAPTLGGVRAALHVIDSIGLPAVVSGAMDSSVGLGSSLALAGAMPGMEWACGLGTGALLAADLIETPLVPVAGLVPIERVAPDAKCLADAAARVRDRQSWLDRLERAWVQLADDEWRERITASH